MNSKMKLPCPALGLNKEESMGKVRIKDREHFEGIFKKFSENEGENFSPELVIESLFYGLLSKFLVE